MIFKKRIEHRGEPAAVNPRKWLPRINHDYCQGCGRCVAACPAQCLALVWSYSTLVRPEDCTSCAACATVCPEHLIVMAWENADGAKDIGRWLPSDQGKSLGQSR